MHTHGISQGQDTPSPLEKLIFPESWRGDGKREDIVPLALPYSNALVFCPHQGLIGSENAQLEFFRFWEDVKFQFLQIRENLKSHLL